MVGGGSRFDIQSVGPLRFLSALVLASAIMSHSRESFRQIFWPIVLLILLGLWMIIQLIPLPPFWWQSLAGRELIAEAGAAIGLSDVWRPITFSPLRTWNSLSSLLVPVAGLSLVALLDENGLQKVRRMVVIAGVGSAVLGIAQITLRGSPGLYLYEITNGDSAVGLFSNRNHNALFLNIALLFAIFDWEALRRQGAASKLPLITVSIFLIFIGVIVNASRFGLALLAIVGLVFAIRLVFRSRRELAGRTLLKQRVLGALIVLGSISLLAVFAFLERIPALDRLLSGSLEGGQRLSTLDTIVALARDHFPFGVGFGAFEQAYRSVEPLGSLSARYLNNAHNDWLQLVVEGGLPAVVLVLAATYLMLRLALRVWKEGSKSYFARSTAWLSVLTLVLIAVHSAIDYPLRTPSIMLVAAIAVGMLCRNYGSRQSD